MSTIPIYGRIGTYQLKIALWGFNKKAQKVAFKEGRGCTSKLTFLEQSSRSALLDERIDERPSHHIQSLRTLLGDLIDRVEKSQFEGFIVEEAIRHKYDQHHVKSDESAEGYESKNRQVLERGIALTRRNRSVHKL